MDDSYKLNLENIAESHIGSFNAFIDTYSKRIVDYLPPVYLSPNYDPGIQELNYTADPVPCKTHLTKTIGKPSRGNSIDEGDERLYPLQARLSHTSYTAALYVTYALQASINGKECSKIISKEVLTGQIPIMVKSKLCNLYGLSNSEMVSKGEDAREPGGYFIIRGNERFVRHVIAARSNYPIAVKLNLFKTKDLFNTKYAIIMRCQRHDASFVGNVLCYTRDGRCVLRVIINRSMKIIPFYVLLKAAKPHMPSSELKKHLLCDFLHNEEMTILFYNIFQDMMSLEPLVSEADFIENRYLHQLGKICWSRVSRYLKPGATMADCGLYVMKNYICVQSESLNDKFDCLMHMFKKLILLARGYIIPDQIDSLAFQEVTLAGHIYSTIIKEGLYSSLLKLKSLLSIELTNFKNYVSISDLDSSAKPDVFMEFCNNVSLFNYLTEKVGPDVPHKLNYFLSTGNSNTSHFEMVQTSGWTIIADRVNYFRFLSHFRSVHRGSIFLQSHSTNMRRLLGESWGFLCPVHTPDGAPCGLLTHLAQYARPVTRASDLDTIFRIRKFIKNLGYTVNLHASGGIELNYNIHRPIPVVVNGIPVARIPSSEVSKFMDNIMKAKLQSKFEFSDDYEIFNTCKANGQMECIHISTFPGRMIRPVLNLKFNSVEWIGPMAQQWSFIAVNEKELNQHIERIKRETSTETSTTAAESDTKILENIPVQYTHLELDQQGILSILASITPFSDHNQSPRNVYQCQMLKQSMGIPLHSQIYRNDNKLYALTTPQSPLVKTREYSRLNLDEYASGANAIVAIIAYTGFDMEDAMVINKASIERGFLYASVDKSIVVDAAPPGCNSKELGNYSFKGPSTANSSTQVPVQLDVDGLPSVGQIITSGSPIARIEYTGKTQALKNYSRVELYKESEKTQVAGITLATPLSTKSNVFAETVPCSRAIIKLRSIRKPDIGDKFASRHGQKGILSTTWRYEDMPFTESGIVPDILFNPHGFPSRMTIGMLIEALAGKAVATTSIGSSYDASTFGGSSSDYFGKLLRESGFQYYGTEDMISGTTGVAIKTNIFMGCIYYQRLRHMVADKAQVRSTGPIDALTHQPVQGRRNKGGIRFGEMERDSLISYGAPHLLQDRLLNCSDLHHGYICPKCGSLLSSSVDANEFTYAGGNTPIPPCVICKVSCHLVRIPYVLLYLTNELASINIGLKFVLERFKNV